MSRDDLRGRVAVVTGGSRGIGGAIVRAAREAGARVIVADRDAPPPREDEARDFRQIDVTSVTAGPALFEAVASAHGSVHLLVNNAGVLQTGPIERVTRADWQRVMQVNLEAVFFLTQAAAPFIAAGGAVVNVASTSAFVASGDQAVYEASKAGVVMLTRSLAIELAPRGVRVNAVAPGLVDTPMTRELFGSDAQFDARVRSRVPLGRAGRPEDMVEAVLFLASGDAAYMTGETLVVDGGWLLT